MTTAREDLTAPTAPIASDGPAIVNALVAPSLSQSAEPGPVAAPTQSLAPIPKGIYLPLPRLGAFALTGLLLVVIWALFVSPNKYGKPLVTAMHAMESMGRIPGSAPQYAHIDIEPIRNTTGSVWANEIASAMEAGERKSQTMSGILASSHGPGVIMAMQEGLSGLHDRCTIRVSAQAFDHQGSPYGALLNRIGSREDSFVVVLAHEMAHCYWHPGPAYETRMNRVRGDPVMLQKMTALMPLVLNIAESYGDAYALIFAARVDRSLYARAYQGITAFRGAKGVKSDIYNTLNAVRAAAEMAPTLPGRADPLNVRWDVTNRYVMSATLTGAMQWLMAQGDSREDAIAKVAFVMQGQGVEFSAREVSGKDYLIVSKVPDDIEARSGQDENQANSDKKSEKQGPTK